MAGLLIVGACSDPEPAAPPADVIEVFSVYRGDDATAFRTVLDRFEQETGYDVVYVGTQAFARRIQERVAEGDPPDVALFPQPSLIRELAEEGRLAPHEPADQISARVLPDPSSRVDIVVDGQIYGVPWKADISGLIWYRPEVFAARGYWIPEDFFDFQALVSQMAFDGVTPWCLGMEAGDATGWVGTDWIEEIVLRQNPAELYDRWSSDEIGFSDDRITGAFLLWRDLTLAPGRTLGGSRAILSTPWERAGDPLFDDDPGCMMVRAPSSYAEDLPDDDLSIGPDGDVDVFFMPGPDGPPPILLAGEFTAAFTGRPGVQELLAFLASPKAGESWAATGGFLSPHPDFDLAAYGNDFERRLADAIDDAEILRFDASDLMTPAVGVGTFWDGVVDYAGRQDLNQAVAIIEAGYDTDAED